MLFRFVYFFSISLTMVTLASAQTNEDILIEQLMESMADEFPEDFDYSDLLEQWNYYLKHPIDLNKTEGKDLIELRFLSPLQVNAILKHRTLIGRYQMTYELQSVDGLHMELVRLLLPFVRVVEESDLKRMDLNDYLREGKNDLIFRFGRILENQKGYGITDATKSRYLGSADRLFVRYRYVIPQNIQISLNMKKDAGEQFFGGAQRYGFDFYSGSIYLQKLRKWEHIVLGDYSLQFGQGLALWTGMRFGKGALVQHVARQGIGLRPYTSSNEFSFLRGAAFTYRAMKKVTITPFVSYKKLSASAQEGVNGQEVYRSIIESGLHRTPNEQANKHNLSQLLLGTNLQYQNSGLTLGTTVYQMHFGGMLEPRPLLYNQDAFRGRKLSNGSVYYHYVLGNSYLYGEIAHSVRSGVAYNSGLITTLSHELSLVLQYRNYQQNYHAFYNQAISEGTNVANERGFYTGLIFQPTKKLLWVVYLDRFRFPWFKYRVDAPSTGNDLFSQLTLTQSKRSKFLLRYRYRTKEENSDSVTNIALIETLKKQQVRVELQFKLNDAIGLRNRAECVYYKKAGVKEFGYLLYQDVLYKPIKGAFSGNIRLAFFHTDSYHTRIYAFENDVLYASSFPVYYNKGIRYYANLRYKIRRGIDVWCRYARSYYPSLDSLGSGLDVIDGKHKSEIKLQMRLQF